MASNLNNMSTIKELKEYLSQFPDDMETDIDIVKLEPWRVELLEIMEKSGYNKTLDKMESNIYKKYLTKSIELMQNTHNDLIEKYPYLKKNE